MRKITDDDLHDHMQAVEGSEWRTHHNTISTMPDNRRYYTIPWALEKWRAWHGERQEFREPHADRTNGIVIYGGGGFNRYFVLYSGEVVFSAHHATPKKANPALGFPDSAIDMARRAGFRIWE